MSALRVLRPREASIFAALVDIVVAPVAPLPPVHRTDAAYALDAHLAAAPRANRLGLRAALLALELAPLALGRGRRLRRLDRRQRTALLARLERGLLIGPVKGLRALAHLSYYGDPAVMQLLGYDADAVLARAAAVRAKEVRW
ncbi:MAG: hypothetical protein JWN65_1340 [Solirubrobacterales bacterium]|jgi:hypothetical protein|nr:hypothetical protein [Solirubrobacterales bacterium]